MENSGSNRMNLIAQCRIFWALGLACLLAWGNPVWAQTHHDHVLERAIWEDATAAASIEQAAQASFDPLPNTSLVRRGYSDAAFWFRVRLPWPSDSPLVLRIQPPYLDEVRLFESTAGGWRERFAGDHHPSASRESADVAFNFAVQANAQNQGVFYLRLKTTSSSIIDIQALTPRDSAEQAADFERFMGVNMGLVTGVLIWAVLQYFLLNREQLVLRFIAYELITLLIALAMAGHLSNTVFADHPRWADTAFNALVAAGTTVLAWFHRHYLLPYGLSKPAQWFLHGVVMLYPFQLVSIVLGHPQWAMQANALLATLCLLVFALETWRIQHPDRLYWGLVRAVYGLLGLMLLPLVGALFGLEIPVQPALYGVTLHGAYGAVLMLLLLNMRLRQERQQAEKFRQDAALAVLQAQQERHHRQEQDQLLAMLAHEIKNPLAVISMVVGAQDKTPRMLQQAGQAVQEVKSIVDQSLSLAHITLEREPERQAVDIADFLADVSDALPDLPDRLHTEGLDGVTLHADALWLKIVGQNLLANALRYSPQQSTITWVVSRQGAHWRVEVSNAVAPDAWPNAQRVFDQFYRGASALKVSGTGLGLYVSRHLARRMGGDLLYEPTSDRVRFTWLIPV
jgi:two-component system, sensor histidine kinase LadS